MVEDTDRARASRCVLDSAHEEPTAEDARPKPGSQATHPNIQRPFAASSNTSVANYSNASRTINAATAQFQPVPRPRPGTGSTATTATLVSPQYSAANVVGDDGEYDAVDVGAIPGQRLIDHSKYAALARRIDEEGWFPIIEAAWITLDAFQRMADDLLCTMDTDVLKQICFGNLAQAYDQIKASSVQLHQGFDKLAERGNDHPSIYLRVFCRGAGQPLDLAQAKMLVMQARAYAAQEPNHHGFAFQIDTALLAKKNTWAAVMNISEPRVAVLNTFANAIERTHKLAEEQGQTHVPLMHYVGYALNASKRKKDQTYSSTHWLSMWVCAWAQVFYKDQFAIRTYTVALITEEWGGPVAEMLVTRLACAYYHTGGFCIDQAGKSTNSFYMDKMTHLQWVAVWDGCLDWIRQNTQYDANKDLENDRRRALQANAFQKRLDDLEEEERSFRADVASFDAV
ncbi:hypothetical protein BU23DRAFT_568623 [Bimuria novae-zelandiae CBS 107.79]|uniref:Uncharacterized protein n=1 Tax=Bimuria novae-zelandiae CBS 107.79 TaxID=1447943 RepID=A0A6A5VDH8_9PLEO|nr:hypothetical protein BU23DRAFT_568623 [Bimuria novae-zelandiae CBS 107.79]